LEPFESFHKTGALGIECAKGGIVEVQEGILILVTIVHELAVGVLSEACQVLVNISALLQWSIV